MKKKRIISLALSFVLMFSYTFAYGHSGGLDSDGGHHNRSTGGYHYHCWGYPAHQHPNGVCPYTGRVTGGGSYSSSSSGSSSSGSTVSKTYSTLSKIQLDEPKIDIRGYKTYIKISWDEVEHAEKYCVYRATSKKGDYTKIATVSGTSYKDKTAKNDKVYYYKIKAFGSGRYTKSFYSRVVSGYRFKGSIELGEENVTLEDGDTYSIFIKATGSKRELKAKSDSDNIKVKLRKTDEDGLYKAVITVSNTNTIEVDGYIDFYYSGRKSRTEQTLYVCVLPRDVDGILPSITLGCEYFVLMPGEVAWFAVFAENMEVDKINGTFDNNLLTATFAETDVEGAALDVFFMVNEDVEPGEEGLITAIDLFHTDNEDEILASMPILIVHEKQKTPSGVVTRFS